MFGPNIPYAAIRRVSTDTAGATSTPQTIDIVSPNKIRLISLICKTEGGTAASLVLTVRVKGGGATLAQFVKFNPVIGQDFSVDFPIMTLVGGDGQALEVLIQMTNATRILSYLNYVVL